MSATPEQVLLREAATAMREHHPVSHPRHEMWWQMAKLLENAAGIEPASKHWPVIMGSFVDALAVARAYMAAVDRPDIDEGTGR